MVLRIKDRSTNRERAKHSANSQKKSQNVSKVVLSVSKRPKSVAHRSRGHDLPTSWCYSRTMKKLRNLLPEDLRTENLTARSFSRDDA